MTTKDVHHYLMGSAKMSSFRVGRVVSLTWTLSLIFMLASCQPAPSQVTPTPQPSPTATSEPIPVAGSTASLKSVTEIPKAQPGKEEIILATTTSTQDSGLLDILVPMFQVQTG